jgi:ketosteroid isomerase-like protein
MTKRLRLIGLALAVASALWSRAVAQTDTAKKAADSAAVIATVERFHALLARADSAAAVRLLAPDLTVLESGDVESRSEYLAHHLGADMAFAKAVASDRKLVGFGQEGNVAWTTTATVSRGQFRDRKIDSRGAELIVLTRSGSGWIIRSIHWSSRRNAP